MTAPEPTSLIALVERRSREIDRRLAAHPDREHLVASRLTAADLLDERLHNSLDLRWSGEELQARRHDSISRHFYTVAAADGTVDVGLLWRWAQELNVVTEEIEVSDETPRRVAEGVVAVARRVRERESRTGTLLTVADVAASRFLVQWACHLDETGQPVGRDRDREPDAATMAEHAEKLSAASPMNRLMSLGRGTARPRSPWPTDVAITAELLAHHARNFGLLLPNEPVPAWPDVVAALVEQLAAAAARPTRPEPERLTVAGAIARRLLTTYDVWIDRDGDLVGRERGTTDPPGRVTADALRSVATPLRQKHEPEPSWPDVLAALRSEVERAVQRP